MDNSLDYLRDIVNKNKGQLEKKMKSQPKKKKNVGDMFIHRIIMSMGAREL